MIPCNTLFVYYIPGAVEPKRPPVAMIRGANRKLTLANNNIIK